MEQRSVARKNPNPSPFAADLQTINELIPEDLSLPSLHERPPRVRGYAFRFFLVLPLYAADGKRIFTEEHQGQLQFLFNTRFSGFLSTASRSGAPFLGEYLPEGIKSVRDYHTVYIVYANPIEPSDRFFRELKSILRKAPLIEQEEILIERSEVYLV
jgi:hypothetical protein